MYQVSLRFYQELNDFLKPELRKKEFNYKFKNQRSVKDLIESFGIPHVEVDLILVNGKSVDFDYIVKNNDRISVYPMFERFDITGLTRVRPKPLRNPGFVLDVHLGKLGRKLRMLGFNADYKKFRNDDMLAEISEKKGRVLLTRDRQLLMRKNITHGLYVRSTDPDEQVKEVVERLDLYRLIKPFSRCMACNGDLQPLKYGSNEFEKLKKRIPPGVREWCREYYRCNSCGKIFWKGSHFQKMDRFIEELSRAPKGHRS